MAGGTSSPVPSISAFKKASRRRLVPDGWPGSAFGHGNGRRKRKLSYKIGYLASGGIRRRSYLVWELLAHLAVLCEKQGTPEPLCVLATTWTRQGSTFCRICRENFMRSTRGCPSVRRFSRWTRQNSWRRRSISPPSCSRPAGNRTLARPHAGLRKTSCPHADPQRAHDGQEPARLPQA